MTTPPDELTTRQAAEALQVTPRTVSRWIKAGRLPARKVPGYNGPYLIAPAALAELQAAA